MNEIERSAYTMNNSIVIRSGLENSTPEVGEEEYITTTTPTSSTSTSYVEDQRMAIMKDTAFTICRKFLTGSWKKISLNEMQFQRVRYVFPSSIFECPSCLCHFIDLLFFPLLPHLLMLALVYVYIFLYTHIVEDLPMYCSSVHFHNVSPPMMSQVKYY